MKNYFFLCSALLLMNAFLQAQIIVNISPPVWGPVVTTEEYYYLPDVESYYDIHQSQFIYLNNGVWIRSKSLPRRYRNYNLNTGHVVIINDYHGHSPYVHFKNHKVKYAKNDRFVIKENSEHHRRNGNGKGHKKDSH